MPKFLKPAKKPLYNTIEGQEPKPGKPMKLIPMNITRHYASSN